jgi:hypothetical protein
MVCEEAPMGRQMAAKSALKSGEAFLRAFMMKGPFRTDTDS